MNTSEKNHSGRNRTLSVTEEDASRLGPKVLVPGDLPETLSFADVLINGDILQVLGLLPDAFADLVIVDPPYNLTKTFRSTRFAAMPTQEYEDYLRTWFHGVCSKLKPDGSLYLCGDWKCSSSLQRVMEEELTVMNRITWQREKGRGASSNWKNAMEDAERAYMDLLALGAKPQEARDVLPLSLKTEVVMTANVREWRHFFELRTSKAAHPQMQRVAKMLLRQFRNAIPVVFDDVGEIE